MQVITLKSGARFEGVIIDSSVHMVIHHEGKNWLVPGTCPHRGGPLHLGTDVGDGIRCPWHGSLIKKSRLIQNCQPYIKTGDIVNIVAKSQALRVALLRSYSKIVYFNNTPCSGGCDVPHRISERLVA
jgi:hypothetical protein